MRMAPLKALREQLGKLQRLAQPYFLPLDGGGAGSGWQFLLLLLAMVAVVVGTTLLLLTGAVALSGALIPDLQARFLPGVAVQVTSLWHQPSITAGIVLALLFVVFDQAASHPWTDTSTPATAELTSTSHGGNRPPCCPSGSPVWRGWCW